MATSSSLGISMGANRSRRATPAAAHSTPTTAPAKREQDALGQQLLDETAAAGADRRAQGHFALAHGRTREQEVRDVDARDEQQQADRAEQRVQRGPEEADDFVCERHGERRPAFVGRRKLPLDTRVKRSQLGVGLFERDAGLQARDRFDEMRAAAVLGEIPDESLVHVDAGWKVEARSRDAQHGVELPVQLHRPSDDVRVAAVSRAPQTIADDDRALAGDMERLRAEAGSERRPDAQHAEEIRAHFDGADAHGILAARRTGSGSASTSPPHRRRPARGRGRRGR